MTVLKRKIFAACLLYSSFHLPSAQAADAAHVPLKHHVVGIFFGISDERSGSDDFTLGFEYEYKFNRKFGAGVVYENIGNAHEGDGIEIVLGSLFYHPYAGWRLGLGVGREKIHGPHGGYETLYRVGAAYDFHFGRYGVAPVLELDRVNGNNVLVYGVAITTSF